MGQAIAVKDREPDDPGSTTGGGLVGRAAPEFELGCTNLPIGGRAKVRLRDYIGSWLLLLFYPRDFSFVCPTELASFSAVVEQFDKRNCRILGVGMDSLDLHEEWLAVPTTEGGLGPLRFPLGSDPEGSASRAYGVYVAERRVAGRGLFLIDPAGLLQYQVVHNLSVGRNSTETLRVLDALQSGGLCPASWVRGDGTIDPGRMLAPGRVLGHYRIQKKLGEGGFGFVLEAWDLWLERTVALKVLRPGRKLDLERVLAEARPAARLSHPNVCLVYSVEVQEELPVIAMEYLRGESLSARLRRGGMAPTEAKRIGHQVAMGVAASHAMGVVHGDLKPSNIMLTESGTVKILDFGLASVTQSPPLREDAAAPLPTDGAPSPSHASRVAMFRGTPPYMSPEHADALPPTTASDVFTFGLVLYEMLTGKRAMPVHSLRSAVRAVRNEDFSRFARELPPPFRGLVALCLSRAPEERPPMTSLAYWLAG
jgi:alkyl hydroperoxide reductase subunit AhpC/predicted Ser/Thr protein kinase